MTRRLSPLPSCAEHPGMLGPDASGGVRCPLCLREAKIVERARELDRRSTSGTHRVGGMAGLHAGRTDEQRRKAAATATRASAMMRRERAAARRLDDE
jgi:hypothetical protein